MADENRFVRLRCPWCGMQSEICDQREDVRRLTLSTWWAEHHPKHRPAPIIERAYPDAPRLAGSEAR